MHDASSVVESAVLRFGHFEFVPSEPALYRDGREVPLPPKPLGVLSVLVASPGAVVSKEALFDSVWNDVAVSDHSLTEAVRHLREALGDDPRNPRYIQTVHRRGYRFVGSVDTEPGSPAIPKANRWVWGATGAGFGAAATFVLLTALSRSPAPLDAPDESNFVLVTNFENATGDSDLDEVVDFSVEWELGNSHVVRVAPPERVNDILRLMKKDSETVLDVELGREVCIRDGGIGSLVAGRIQRIDGVYLLRATVLEPHSGATLAAVERQAESKTGILEATRELARDIRSSLGDHPPELAARPGELAKVTTSSLRALEFFSRGARAIKVGRPERGSDTANARAAELFQRAVEEDPDFATGHIYLAHAYSNLGKSDLAAPHYERAFELAESATSYWVATIPVLRRTKTRRWLRTRTY